MGNEKIKMKKTPLQRKTPLKCKTPLKSKSGLSSSSMNSKRATKKKETTSCKGKINGLEISARKGFGLQGKGRNNQEREHHSQLTGLGCFACNHLRQSPTTPLVVHHIDGRYQGGASDISEWLTMCLCYEHHDPSQVSGMSTKGLSVHHNKSLFKKLIGLELWCVYESFRYLSKQPIWLHPDKWIEYLEIDEQANQTAWIIDNHRPPFALIE